MQEKMTGAASNAGDDYAFAMVERGGHVRRGWNRADERGEN